MEETRKRITFQQQHTLEAYTFAAYTRSILRLLLFTMLRACDSLFVCIATRESERWMNTQRATEWDFHSVWFSILWRLYSVCRYRRSRAREESEYKAADMRMSYQREQSEVRERELRNSIVVVVSGFLFKNYMCFWFLRSFCLCFFFFGCVCLLFSHCMRFES